MTHGVKWKPWLYSIIGAVIGSFTLGRVFWELEPFFHNGQHQFSVSVDTWKTGDPNFGGSIIGSFAIGWNFGELELFLHFFIMADTNFLLPSTLRKLETQTLEGSVIGCFALGHVFGELELFFHFFIVADTNFLFLSTLRKPWWPFCT